MNHCIITVFLALKWLNYVYWGGIKGGIIFECTLITVQCSTA